MTGWFSPRGTCGCVQSVEHEGSTTLPEVLPHGSPDQLPPTTGTWNNGAPIG